MNRNMCIKCWCDVIKLSNLEFLQSIALHPQFWIINPPFSILLHQISFIQLQFSIFNTCFSILSKKYGIFASKSPQNSVISDKMSASATCTACSFFQVWALEIILIFRKFNSHLFRQQANFWEMNIGRQKILFLMLILGLRMAIIISSHLSIMGLWNVSTNVGHFILKKNNNAINFLL